MWGKCEKPGNDIRNEVVGQVVKDNYSTYPEVDISLVVITTKNVTIGHVTHTLHSHVIQHIPGMTTTDTKGKGVCTAL